MYNHHVVAVSTQPGVHGLADAADFVQGWSMVVRPAKVQHLGEEGRLIRQRLVVICRRGEEGEIRVYLWIKLADVVSLLTEIEELRKNRDQYYKFLALNIHILTLLFSLQC